MAAPERVSRPVSPQRREELFRFRQMVDDPATATYLWTLMDRCGVFHHGFDSDPLVMANLTGQKRVGLRVLADFIEGAPEVFAQMVLSPPTTIFEEVDDDRDRDAGPSE